MVKQGYKQTEIDVIPEDWEVKELNEVGTIGSSKRIFESDYVDYGVPFYRRKEISLLIENKIIDEPYYISEERFKSLLSKYGAPQKDDLLITAVGTLGNIYHVKNNRQFYFKDGNLIWIRKIDGNSKFIKIALDYHKNQILENAIGSSQKALTIKSLSITKIPLPPLAEQEAIATVLSDADAWIDNLEQLIAKKRLIKQGAMQELLTPPSEELVLSGVEAWDVKKLGEVAEIIIGLTYSPNDVSEYGTLVLRSSNIQNNKLAFNNNVFVNMKLPERVIVKENDLLVCVRNGSKQLIGKCALIDKKTAGQAFGAFMSIIRCDFGEYLYHYFQTNHIQNQIDENLGATINQLTNAVLKSFEIYIPKSLSEQERIATILSDMDAELEALVKQLGKAQQIKQGMMQELLTGRVRLV